MEVNLLKCVICRDEYEEDKKRRMLWESACVDSNSKSKDDLRQLRSQLSVMLLVRKILGLSPQVLQTMLRDHGNPSEWGLKMCGPCGRIFKEVEFVHGRLSQLHLEYKELSNKLVEQLQKSRETSDNETTSIKSSRVGRKPKRNRARMTSLLKAVNASETSDCIRQEFFKKKGNGGGHYEEISVKQDIDILSGQDSCHDAFSELGDEVEGEVVEKKPNLELLRKNEHRERQDNPLIEEPSSSPMPDECEDDEFQPHLSDENDVNDADSDYEAPAKKKRGRPANPMRVKRFKKSTKVTSSSPPREKIDVFSVPQPIKRELDYQCPLCTRTALSKSSCHGHILRQHYKDSYPFHCHLCDRKYAKENSLRTHLEDCHDGAKTPLDENDDSADVEQTTKVPTVQKNKVEEGSSSHSRKYQCNLCTKTKFRVRYKNLDTLEAHKKKVHMGISKPYDCNLCSQAFKSNTERRLHLHFHRRREREEKARSAISSKSIKGTYCSSCDRHFKTPYLLQCHYKTKPHISEFPFLCEYCTRGFMSKISLESHRAQDHHAELNLKPFQCKFCSRILSTKRSLDHHTRLQHTKLTLFKCPECPTQFMFEHTYKKHIAHVHRKERSFLCTYCPRAFTLKNHLETHIRTHTGEKPYTCTQCGKAYSDRPTFRRHLETHGSQIYTCSVCNRQFKVWHTYRNHMKGHNIYLKRLPEILATPTATSTANILGDQSDGVQTPQISETCNSQMDISTDTYGTATENESAQAATLSLDANEIHNFDNIDANNMINM